MSIAARIVILLAVLSIVSCRLGGGTVYRPPRYYEGQDYYALLDIGSGRHVIDLTCCGSAAQKDAYILLTNGTANLRYGIESGAVRLVDATARGDLADPGGSTEEPSIDVTPYRVRGKRGYEALPLPELEDSASSRSVSSGGEPVVGDTTTFTADYATVDDTVTATLRYRSDPISVADGAARVLEIWVADHAWMVGGTAGRLMDQSMVDAAASRFLSFGEDNDIYDWVRDIFGAEWGSHGVSSLIPDTGRITILFLDIDDDDATEHGVLGYFHSRDTHLTHAASNERVMFYMDSVFYATKDADALAWSVDQELPSEILATLAHELQHVVQYYQKTVRRGVTSRTWLNEMASLAAEDLIADRLGVAGPRGVAPGIGDPGEPGNTAGRLPLYGREMTDSLTGWTYDEATVRRNYASTYAFGAFLGRNYGGAPLLGDIVRSSSGDYSAVVEAVRKRGGDVSPDDPDVAFRQLLVNWGVAAVISDLVSYDVPLEYNTGTWMTDGRYRLGSINLWNYDHELGAGPRTYAPSELGAAVGILESKPASTIVVYAGRFDAAAGNPTLDIDVPTGITASVVVRSARELP